MDPRPIHAGGWAMAVMVLSIVLTLALVAAQSRALKQASSVAVHGDRAHYAADLASNVAAILGIAGASLLGLYWLDAAAGNLPAAPRCSSHAKRWPPLRSTAAGGGASATTAAGGGWGEQLTCLPCREPHPWVSNMLAA
jgi:hypothetical protein